MAPLPLIVSLVVAVVVSALLSGVVAWAGPIDRPRERGAHDRPVPTSGGVAIMAGASLGLALLAHWTGGAARSAALPLTFAAAMGLLGAADDLIDLGARTKLVLQAAAALAFAAFAARVESLDFSPHLRLAFGPVLGALGTTLWLVVVVNATNFMDGANGLAAGALAIADVAFAAASFAVGAPDLGVPALIGAASTLGFLPWNLSGRLFQGDAGALFSSALLASVAVVGASAQRTGAPVSAWLAPLALLPLLTDVLLTLLDRARRRRSLLSAHREHLYQRWLSATGKPHTALAWRAYLIAAAFGTVAVGAGLQPALGATLFAALTVLSAGLWLALRRRL